MRRIYIKTIAAILCCTVIMTGCSDGNESKAPITLPAKTTAAPKETTTAATTTEATTTAKTTTAPVTVETEAVVSDSGIEEDYGIYTLSDEDKDYISELVFVGDSICRGYNVYGLIPDEHSLAHGNVAARSIMDYTFDVNGRELNYICALYDKQPKYVVFSMGMNDINMTSKEIFCENYRSILESAGKYCPNSYLIVLGITPICSEFSTNSEIDIYNAALAEMIENENNEKWLFRNAEDELKNTNNELKSLYSGGDGIHLSPDAYKAVLWYLCRNRVDYELGDEKIPAAPDGYKKPNSTTVATETKPPITTVKPQTTKPKITTESISESASETFSENTSEATSVPISETVPEDTTETPQIAPPDISESSMPAESSEPTAEITTIPEEIVIPDSSTQYIELPVE